MKMQNPARRDISRKVPVGAAPTVVPMTVEQSLAQQQPGQTPVVPRSTEMR